MTTTILRPNSDISVEMTPSEGTFNYEAVNDVVTDASSPSATPYVDFEHSGPFGGGSVNEGDATDVYGLTDVSGYTTLTSVQVKAHIEGGSASGPTLSASANVKLDGWKSAVQEAVPSDDTGVWYTFTIAGPFTEADVAAINSMEVSLRVDVNAPQYGRIIVRSVYVEIQGEATAPAESMSASLSLATQHTGSLRRFRRMGGAGTASLTAGVSPDRTAGAVIHPYAESRLLKHLFGITSWSPASMWMAVCGTRPTSSDSGLTLDEPDQTDNQYARVQTNASTWMVTEDGEVMNTVDIQFPVANANWPAMNYLVFLDQPFGGNIYAYAPLAATVNIETSQSLNLEAYDGLRFWYGANTAISRVFRGVISRRLFNQVLIPTISDLAIAALYVRPLTNSTGVSIYEPRGLGYSRCFVGVGGDHWEYVNNQIQNIDSLVFGSPTSPWGVITHAAVCTTLAHGRPIVWNGLGTPAVATTGQPLTLGPGTLRFRLR